jgi:hypothetical protein
LAAARWFDLASGLVSLHAPSQLSYSNPAESPKWLSNFAINALRCSFVSLIATPVFVGDLSFDFHPADPRGRGANRQFKLLA